MSAATLTRTAKAGAGRAASRIGAARAARDRLDGRAGGLADGVGERLKIICRRAGGLGDLKPHDLPAERRRESGRMPGAQVVAVRLGVGRERPEHGCRLCIDVGERRNRRLTAGGPGASTKRAHEREG